jgi:hypothetical protein
MTELASSWNILGPMRPHFDTVLTPDALEYLAGLARRFPPTVRTLAERHRLKRRCLRCTWLAWRSSLGFMQALGLLYVSGN